MDKSLEFLWNQELPQITLTNLVTWIAAGAMIFGGVVPYVPQYRDIKRTQNADGFSTFVCFILLLANLLRILFWFGKHFELPLLAQSVIMIVTMLAMVKLCVYTRNRSEIIQSKPHSLTDTKFHRSDENLVELVTQSREFSPSHRHRSTFLDFEPNYFWKWTDFLSYVQFLLVFTIIMAAITYFLLEVTIYVETIGFLAVFFEAMLGSPQFYRNFQNKSTLGMSIKMVLMWSCGDIFKTCYFIIRASPPQFWICGILQVSIDFAILFQVYYYKKYPQTSSKPVHYS